MLSVLIQTRNDEEGLARTLACLVSGAVEGVVREVIVCDRGSTDYTHIVAEHAGCTFLADGDAVAAIRHAKGEWLLLLEPGARLLEGWIDTVVEHMARQTNPARFTRARGSGHILVRLFSTRRPLAAGLLISKGQALARSAQTGKVLPSGRGSRKLAAQIVLAVL